MTTTDLAERYAKLTFDELPDLVVDRVREVVLDTLGVAIGGQGLASSSLAAEVLMEMGGRAESSVIGHGAAPAPLAALVNATTSHGLELDDVDNSSSLHPGVVVIPTALATAEAVSSSGRDLTTAIVAGYDAILRIGRSAGPLELYSRGFHPTATCGVFGSAVTAGRLLGLDPGQMANALGIAGSFASGNLEYMSNGSWTKRLQVGGAALAGTLAARLARRGYTGPVTILEGQSGFLRAHSERPDFDLLGDDLANPFGIMDVSVKPFACCRYCHTPIDATLQLLSQTGIEPRSVARVDVGMVSAGVSIVAEPRDRKVDPHNSVDAQFSLPYAIAVALARGRAFVEEFCDAAVADPEIRQFMPLVHAHAEAELDELYPRRWPARVKITMTDGAAPQLLLTSCRGDPDKRLSATELEEKFRRLAEPWIDGVTLKSILAEVSQLELLGDVSTLMKQVGVSREVLANGGA